MVRPIRYTDSELYAERGGDNARVKVALVFPDTYEIGMSNYGLKVLYHIVNRMDDAHAERAFLPWVDMVEEMKAGNIPLASLETRTPLGEFDMVGISLESELGYTNALAVLELSRIPLRWENRSRKDPVIVGGGPCTANPLPLAPFFDAFLVGDGEDAVREMVKVMRGTRNRQERVAGLAEIQGMWVPLIHGKDKPVKRRMVDVLRLEDTPVTQPLPIGEISHDRLVVEIGRGCLRGCRFCQAGFSNRPARYRSVEEILRLAADGIKATGWEEVSLLSFAVSDHPRIEELLEKLNSVLGPTRTAISLPSFRGEAFTESVGRKLKKIRKTGLTFAPETASPRLKRVINKTISNQSILDTVQTAARLGWRRCKLYFMVGLPGETPEDMDMNIEFIRELARSAKSMTVNVHTSAFVPKPHTPFQWVEFESLTSLSDKLERFRTEIGLRRVRAKWAQPEASFIEAVLARGDERLAEVLEGVLQRGGYFQEWSEHFKLERWEEALGEKGIDPGQYTGARDVSENLPWDFLDIGVSAQFLKAEYRNALESKVQPDCISGPCYTCGMDCREKPPQPLKQGAEQHPDDAGAYTLGTRIRKGQSNRMYRRFRLKLELGEQFRYASHLDVVRAVYRLLRRSGLPVSYTEGFSPHPRVRFGFPKPVGVTSRGDYLDIELISRPSGDVTEILNACAPDGLKVLGARVLTAHSPAITKVAEVLHYMITPAPALADAALAVRGRSGPNIRQVNATNGKLSLFLDNANRAKLWDSLAHLYDITSQEARSLSAERIDTYVRKGSRLYTPIEES